MIGFKFIHKHFSKTDEALTVLEAILNTPAY